MREVTSCSLQLGLRPLGKSRLDHCFPGWALLGIVQAGLLCVLKQSRVHVAVIPAQRSLSLCMLVPTHSSRYFLSGLAGTGW